MLLPDLDIKTEALHDPLFAEKKIRVYMARLDLVHPVVSGNKLFKLHYFVEEAVKQGKKSIVTFGGAYSNHLVATAFYCRQLGLKSIGYVRGEQTTNLSHTVKQCIQYGMQTEFLPRAGYSGKDDPSFIKTLQQQWPDAMIIPEGGYHPLGAAGAAHIMDAVNILSATHVCTAVGTSTTLAGLIRGSSHEQAIIAIPVLKGLNDLSERLSYLLENKTYPAPVIFDQYHFGGYAKKTPALLHFMNTFYSQHAVPTDFVYTAKMMFAVYEQAQCGFFKEGSTIVCVHTGGLQGNDSLPEGSLVF